MSFTSLERLLNRKIWATGTALANYSARKALFVKRL